MFSDLVPTTYSTFSCVKTIEEALSALSPTPTSVYVSIVSQSVTVIHPVDLPITDILSTLDAAGFDVLDSPNSPSSSLADVRGGSPCGNSGGVNQFLTGKRSKHVQQCSLCREEDNSEAKYDSMSAPGRHIIGSEVTDIPRHHVAEEADAESIRKLSLDSRDNDRDEGPFRITLSVGGMTCSSCSGTITKMVSDLQGVSEVAVSLLSKSATVIVEDRKLVEVVIEAVEDCGFEVEVISVDSLKALEHGLTPGPRTVALRIDGMFCQ